MEFKAERFRDAVLYIAWRMRDNEKFGRIKLAKTLFYADFDSYAEEGQPVTGARYEHFENGPFPPVLYDLVEDLERNGDAKVIGGQFAGDEMRLIPPSPPHTPHLTAQQQALLDVEMDRIAELPSWKVSDDSHVHPGWRLTGNREEIPYAAALVPKQPSPKVLEIARRRFSGQGRSATS